MTEREAAVLTMRALGIHQEYSANPVPANLPKLDQAIEMYEAVLREPVQEVHRAGVQDMLAKAHLAHPRGDRAEHVRKAIEYLSAAVTVLDRLASHPTDAAEAHLTLAVAYRSLPTADRGESLRRAIEHCEAAARTYTETTHPARWAAIQNDIGALYLKMPTGRPADNQRLAFDCFDRALRVARPDTHPAEWATIKLSLANAYQTRQIDREANLQKSIDCCRDALRVFTEESAPGWWATAMQIMGLAYEQFPANDRAGVLSEAIRCYENALRVHREETFPDEFAMINANLAIAFGSLPGATADANLRRSIECSRAALRVYSEETHPVEWAKAMHNLASALIQLPTGDREANLLEAIACYRNAQRVLTETTDPVAWATINHDLGAAYQMLPTGDQQAHLRAAIASYEAALRVRDEHSLPIDWAATQSDLGIAYSDLSGDGEANVSRAIAHLEAAMRVNTKRALPEQWAATNVTLGNTLQDRQTDRAGSLRTAIDRYRDALTVYTETAFPIRWAETLHNLGNAYRRLPDGDRSDNRRIAKESYAAALRVLTPAQMPAACLRTHQHLADLQFHDGEWAQALDHYEAAIAVIERLRTESARAAERRRIVRDSAHVFDRAIVAAIRTGQPGRALTLAERAKTRNLSDQLWRRDMRPRRVAEDEWRAYQAALDEAERLEFGQRAAKRLSRAARPQGDQEDVPADADLLARLRRLHYRIRADEARFRDADPDYVPFARPLSVGDIAVLARASTAVIVEFRVTPHGTFVFLVGPGNEDVSGDQVVHVPAMTDRTLSEMLTGSARGTRAWLRACFAVRDLKLPFRDWLAVVDEMTRELYDTLCGAVRARLRERYPGIGKLILVPNKGLNLLPLHACWWEDDGGRRRYLLDDYDITYAPSCLVLQRSLIREAVRPTGPRTLFAVQNPDGSLKHANREVTHATGFFAKADRTVLAGAAASEAAVKAAITFGSEKLFSCHGLFDLTDVEASYLALHGSDRLAVPDVMSLDLSGTWLAVMSACETGLTDIHDVIDEYQGLPAAFLIAGAATVIPTLWSVSDFSTALLMGRFHDNLYARQLGKGPALCEAQRWLRDARPEDLSAEDAELASGMVMNPSDNRPFANPYWWGAFQCIGSA